YKYLQSLTGDNQYTIPGFGENFVLGAGGKYGDGNGAGASERDQILTLMMDYMRTVNLVDTGTSFRATGGNKFEPYTPFYGAHGYNIAVRPAEWTGQVTPLQISEPGRVKTMGMGRFLTVSEAALIFYRKGRPVKPTSGDLQPPPQMEAVLALEMSTPMPG